MPAFAGMPNQVGGNIYKDIAYIAGKAGGHFAPGPSGVGAITEDMPALGSGDQRRWALVNGNNTKPVVATQPDVIAVLADKTGQVAVAITAIDCSLAFTLKTTATDIARYFLEGTLPTGLAFAAATGIITGTPAAGQAGTYYLRCGSECDTGKAINYSNMFKLTIAP